MCFITAEERTSNTNLNQLEPSFMYTKIVKSVFLEMKHDAKVIENLVEYWRKLYHDNMRKKKEVLDAFERDYHPDKVIWRYTRECFTYELINRALHTLDGDVTVNMEAFLHDLHKQLMSSIHSRPVIAYCRQGLPKVDFERSPKTMRGRDLLSFNNFLSVNRDCVVSVPFASSISTDSDKAGVLFMITIDSNAITTSYASLERSEL